MQGMSPHLSSTPGNSLTYTPKGVYYVPYKIRPTVEINHHTVYIPNNDPCQTASISVVHQAVQQRQQQKWPRTAFLEMKRGLQFSVELES